MPALLRPAAAAVRAAPPGSGAADAAAPAGVPAASGGQPGASEDAAAGEGRPDEEHHLQVSTAPNPAQHRPHHADLHVCLSTCTG